MGFKVYPEVRAERRGLTSCRGVIDKIKHLPWATIRIYKLVLLFLRFRVRQVNFERGSTQPNDGSLNPKHTPQTLSPDPSCHRRRAVCAAKQEGP